MELAFWKGSRTTNQRSMLFNTLDDERALEKKAAGKGSKEPPAWGKVSMLSAVVREGQVGRRG